jgi:hypothetical protein
MYQYYIRMAELQKFRESFANKSKATQHVYNSTYKKLRDFLGDDIVNVSQKNIIKIIQENIDNLNTQQSLINVAHLVRKQNGAAINELDEARLKNRTNINNKVYEANTNLIDKLPSYDTLVSFVDGLLENKKYVQYIINYLVLYYQVRNADVNFDFVTLKKDTKDDTKNYLWFSATTKTVHYIRNVYKTAHRVGPDGTVTGYGQKHIKITDPKFIDVMKILVKHQKTEKKPVVFIPNPKTVAYFVQTNTYQGLGETMYFKIVVNKFRTDPNMLKQISYNRGTDIKTILESYDIESEPINQD